MTYVIWLSGSPDPTRREMQIWPGQIADFVLNGKPHPRKLCEIEMDPEDLGKSINHLRMMERYALPACFKAAIEGDKVGLVAKPTSQIQQPHYEVI